MNISRWRKKYNNNSNVMLMEEAVRRVKIKVFKKDIVYQIDHVTLHEKVCLLVGLVGMRGRFRTDSFDKKNRKSQFKWNF